MLESDHRSFSSAVRDARGATVLSVIRDCLDALLHPSARSDALTRARHRSFIAPRLLGSLASFAVFPIYLAMRGAPTALEVVAFAWLTAPILLSWFLSRTGHYESACILSSLALAGLVMTLSVTTGGIESFAAIWLVIVPLEAALSTSRRVVTFASALALSCTSLLIVLGNFHALPAAEASPDVRAVLAAFGVASATFYAAGLAFGSESLARVSVSLLNVEEERYRLLAQNMGDVISQHHRNGAVRFISPAAEGMVGSPVTRLLGHGLFEHVHVADRPAYLNALSDAARSGDARSVEFRLKRGASSECERGQGSGVEFIWVEMRCRQLEKPAEAAPSSESEWRRLSAPLPLRLWCSERQRRPTVPDEPGIRRRPRRQWLHSTYFFRLPPYRRPEFFPRPLPSNTFCCALFLLFRWTALLHVKSYM